LKQTSFIIHYSGGRLTPHSQLDLTHAGGSVARRGQGSGQHGEVWYYAGMKRLLAGDKETAADDFNRSLTAKQIRYSEYRLAEAELEALGLANKLVEQFCTQDHIRLPS
jgi:hypothetical protein